MTTVSEERVRALLDAAAPEPTRTFDGSQIRRAVDELPGEVLPWTRRSRSTMLSAVLAAAAIVVVAFIAAGLVGRGGHRATPPAASAHSTPSTTPSVTTAPPDCGQTLVLTGGKFIGPSDGDGTITLTVRNSQRRRCTMPRVPSIRLTFDGGVVSTLPASDYQPPRPIVVGPHRSARIVVALRADHTCAGMGAGKTQLVFALDGFSYGFDQHLDGCQYTIAAAQVRQDQ